MANGTVFRLLPCCLSLLLLTVSPDVMAQEDPANPSFFARCRQVLPDEEFRCRYRAIDPRRHNILFTDIRDGGSIRAADIRRPDQQGSALIFESLADFGLGAQLAVASPDLRRVLIMRPRSDCPEDAPPGCRTGETTLWLASHDPKNPFTPWDDEWVQVNLARRGFGVDSRVVGWSTWLHKDLALFNGLSREGHGNWQVYAVRFRSDADFTIEPFEPDLLWRDLCLTGRVNAQPPRDVDRCFDGQRLVLVRRCLDEPRPGGWAWWNTRKADGTGGACVDGERSGLVPVLRSYVVELDSSCRPKKSFTEMVPVREPESGPYHRMMGIVPEWGDMLSTISPDGRYLAFSTNMADPSLDSLDNCGGLRTNLLNRSNPLSGFGLRWTHICELDSGLRCRSAPNRIGVERTPAESTPLPGFVGYTMDGVERLSLVYTREWGVWNGAMGRDAMRLDFQSGLDSRVPLTFAASAIAINPIQHVPRHEPDSSIQARQKFQLGSVRARTDYKSSRERRSVAVGSVPFR